MNYWTWEKRQEIFLAGSSLNSKIATHGKGIFKILKNKVIGYIFYISM